MAVSAYDAGMEVYFSDSRTDGFKNTVLNGVPVNYVKPVASGDILFNSDRLAVNEFYRVLTQSAHALVISMGRWCKWRSGLAKRERARNALQKLRPTSVHYVTQKPPLDGHGT
jgi:hypothetical protein